MKRLTILNIIILIIMTIYVIVLQIIKNHYMPLIIIWIVSELMRWLIYMDLIFVIYCVFMSFSNRQYICLVIIGLLFFLILILDDYYVFTSHI
jgi:hypothetical protein